MLMRVFKTGQTCRSRRVRAQASEDEGDTAPEGRRPEDTRRRGMKVRPCKSIARSVSETVDDVRVAHTVEGDGFVAKVFEQRPFKLGIWDALQRELSALMTRFPPRREWPPRRARDNFRNSCRDRDTR